MLSVYLALTPVLLTLTEPYADDTVGTLAALFLALHLVSHDYFPQSARPASPGAVSLNAGVVATVLLASRLHSTLVAFCSIVLGLAAVEGIPRFRDSLWRLKPAVAAKFFTAVALLLSMLHFGLLFCGGEGEGEWKVGEVGDGKAQVRGAADSSGLGGDGGGLGTDNKFEEGLWLSPSWCTQQQPAAAGLFLATLVAFWVACPLLYVQLHHFKVVISGYVHSLVGSKIASPAPAWLALVRVSVRRALFHMVCCALQHMRRPWDIAHVKPQR